MSGDLSAKRALAGKIGAHESWARTTDRPGRTAAARRAALARFEHEADPDGVLSEEERARRARHLQQAHMARLTLASIRARRRKAAGAPRDAA
jgi:hypothetical protein